MSVDRELFIYFLGFFCSRIQPTTLYRWWCLFFSRNCIQLMKIKFTFLCFQSTLEITKKRNGKVGSEIMLSHFSFKYFWLKLVSALFIRVCCHIDSKAPTPQACWQALAITSAPPIPFRVSCTATGLDPHRKHVINWGLFH